MSRPTLAVIHATLKAIQSDVHELKTSKVSKDVYQLNLDAIEEKVVGVKEDIKAIQSYGKWAILLVGSTIIGAVMTLILRVK